MYLAGESSQPIFDGLAKIIDQVPRSVREITVTVVIAAGM
jgi:hypothetical protein